MAVVKLSDSFLVECVNNTGLEEHFEEGVKYWASPHHEAGMLFVSDGAMRCECFAERFGTRFSHQNTSESEFYWQARLVN